MVFYFVNIPSSHSLDSLHKTVVGNGGTFSMNLNDLVTHSVASVSKGIKFQAAKRHGDVILYSWFADCCSQKKLLPLQPRYFLFLSDTSKKKLEEEIDEFSDSYYLDLNITDLKQILSNMGKVEHSKAKEYYKKKFCPREEWVRFHGCCIYFHLQGENRNWEVPLEFAMRRMKIEICIGGGSVAETLSHATTHLVIVASPQIDMDFDTLLNSFSVWQKRLLHSASLQIVKSQWLDDCLEKDRKLPEDSYSLVPQGFRRTLTGESDKQEPAAKEYNSLRIGQRDASSSSYKGMQKDDSTPPKPRIVGLPNNRIEKRKRGRPIGTSTKKVKPVVNKPRRTRPRAGNKPAKISEIESDKSASLDDDKEDVEANEIVENKPDVIGGNELAPEIQKKEAVKDSTPEKGEEPYEINEENSSGGEILDEINKVGYGHGSGSTSTRYNNRAEDTVDPIQAMLLNMVPSLATKKFESWNSVPEEVRDKDDVVRTREEGKQPVEAGSQPVKKQKISYKNLVKELLEDW